MFTYEKKHRALQLYEQTHSVTETIRILGYPECVLSQSQILQERHDFGQAVSSFISSFSGIRPTSPSGKRKTEKSRKPHGK